MNNRYISAINFEHSDVSSPDWICLVIGEQQKIATEESRLHWTYSQNESKMPT